MLLLRVQQLIVIGAYFRAYQEDIFFGHTSIFQRSQARRYATHCMILRCRSHKYVITVSLPSTVGLLEMSLQKAVVEAGASQLRRYQ